MTPTFSIRANGEDITALIRDRLIALTLSDESGASSDRLEVELDDRDHRIGWPEHGAQLSVAMGYAETGLGPARDFIVDEISARGPPSVLMLRAQAADMRTSLKGHKTRHWESIALESLVKTVAAEHGLDAKVADTLGALFFANLDQTDESDMHFLTRIAHEYDAIVKPVNSVLIVVPKREATSASGQALESIRVDKKDIVRYRFTQAQRARFLSVQARWYDDALGAVQCVSVGDGDPVYSLRHTFTTDEEARMSAIKKQRQLLRAVSQLSLSVVGNVRLQAEAPIALEGLRFPLNGEWVIERVVHTLNAQGFTSELQLEALTQSSF